MKPYTNETSEAGRAGSGENGMLMRCTTASAKEAAASTAKGRKADKEAVAGERCGLAKEGLTKRKAAAGSSKGKKAATSASAAGGVPEGEKCTADVAMAAAEEGGEEEGLTRLSQEYVDSILSWKPECTQDPDEYYARMTSDPLNLQLFSQEYIEKSTEILRDLAEMSKRTAVEFEKFQAWARAEYEEKGYVEVDDEYIAQRVLLRQAVASEVWNEVEGLEVEGDDEEYGRNASNQGDGVALESN